MSNTNNMLNPVASTDRILSLDVLRGFAALGILLMNIQSFSMIEAAYINPAAYGDLTGINRWVWILSHILTDQKFLSIFSILFGAGIILMSQRIESRGISPVGFHYRRTFWLLIIGLIHAYVFWHGDILVPYAFCSMLVFLFRKKRPKTLLILGLIIFSVSSAIYLFFGASMSYWPPEGIQNLIDGWKPGSEIINHEIATYRGNWLEQMAHRVPSSVNFQVFIFLIWTGWRAGGLMLIGMALHKWNILSAELSRSVYIKIIFIGFLVGLPIVIYGIFRNFAMHWSHDYSMFFGSQFNYWGSLFTSMGYIGGIMLYCKSGKPTRIKTTFASVGQMALTNYLAQTVICTLLFYGHGFGLFGKVERIGQIGIVIVVWIICILFSSIWMKHFRSGPAEWLWRSLTYRRFQPIKK